MTTLIIYFPGDAQGGDGGVRAPPSRESPDIDNASFQHVQLQPLEDPSRSVPNFSWWDRIQGWDKESLPQL